MPRKAKAASRAKAANIATAAANPVDLTDADWGDTDYNEDAALARAISDSLDDAQQPDAAAASSSTQPAPAAPSSDALPPVDSPPSSAPVLKRQGSSKLKRQASVGSGSACSCLAEAKAWLASPANTLHFKLVATENADEAFCLCPTLGVEVGFSLVLSAPHGISVDEDCVLLEDLEAESYDFIFGDAAKAATGSHDGCTLKTVLEFAHGFVKKLDSAWEVPTTTPSNKQRSADPFDDGGDEGKEGDDAMGDDEGFGGDDGGFGDGDDDGEWGDVGEIDLLTSGVEAQKKEKALNEVKSMEIVNSVTLFTKEEVIASQAAMIPRVATALGVSNSAAVCLLRTMKWNEEACLQRYKSEPAKFVADAHCNALLRGFIQTPTDNEAEVECGVCYCEYPAADTFAMSCGHRFCMTCWQAYLTSELEGGTIAGANALTSKCMGNKCTEILGMECIEMLLSISEDAATEAKNKKLLERYENLLQMSFVDDSEHLNWCPGKGCTYVIRNASKLPTVKCKCGTVSCFKCNNDAHAPCSCKEATDWMLRDTGSNLDMKFLLEQTKACPHCGVRTKKEGGCMFLSCAQCKKTWCWHCGQSGDNHHVWECNRPQYQGSDTKSEQGKYLFYFERFHNHKAATQIASKQIDAAQKRMNELVDSGMHYKQVEFLLSATNLVLQCRRVLSWSYARAFFLSIGTDRNAQTLFEYRQSELEQYTEKLNQLTEGSIEKLTEDRLLVLDWTRALTRYLANMEIDESVVGTSVPKGATAVKIAPPATATTPTAAATASATPPAKK